MITNVRLYVWVELSILFFVCLAGVFFGSRYIGEVWAYFPYQYQQVTITNAPTPGGFLDLEISVSRTKSCPQIFYREIYDGKGARIEQYQWTQGAKPTGPDSYGIKIPITKQAQTGPLARYCWSQAPLCNPIQQAFPYWTPLKCQGFEIVEDK